MGLNISYRKLVGSFVGLLLTTQMYAAPTDAIKITPLSSSINIRPMQTSPTPARFEVRNTTGASLPRITIDSNYIPNKLFTTSLLQEANSCRIGGHLGPHASCELVMNVKAGSRIGSSVIKPRFCAFDGAFCYQGELSVNVVSNPRGTGHFAFKNSLDREIASLNLVPGASGTVILYNTGGGKITHFILRHGALPSGSSLDGTCMKKNELTAHGHCTIVYQITHAADAGNFDITASGSGTNNNNESLKVSVVSAGRLVFKNRANKEISQLDLAPGSMGTIYLYNTGQTDITDLSLCTGQYRSGVTLLMVLVSVKAALLQGKSVPLPTVFPMHLPLENLPFQQPEAMLAKDHKN